MVHVEVEDEDALEAAGQRRGRRHRHTVDEAEAARRRAAAVVSGRSDLLFRQARR